MDMSALKKYIEISPKVQDALDHNKPIIAMETTIVAQGFPYPENVKMAHSLAQIARSMGVVPATIGILHGKVIVGMSDEQVEYMGSHCKECPKASRRDLAAMLGLGLRRVYSSPDGYESAGEGAYTKTFRFGRKVDKRFFCATADE